MDFLDVISHQSGKINDGRIYFGSWFQSVSTVIGKRGLGMQPGYQPTSRLPGRRKRRLEPQASITLMLPSDLFQSTGLHSLRNDTPHGTSAQNMSLSGDSEDSDGNISYVTAESNQSSVGQQGNGRVSSCLRKTPVVMVGIVPCHPSSEELSPVYAEGLLLSFENDWAKCNPVLCWFLVLR